MKKAFTLIEVIFIIVVVGILSTIAISRFNSKDLLRGAEMVARDIEYVKHLAVIDDNRVPNNEKISTDDYKSDYKNFWFFKIVNVDSNPKILIFKHIKSTDYSGNIENAAVDYLDKEKLLAVGNDDGDIYFNGVNKTSSRVYLKKTYAIKKVELGGCKNSKGAQVNTILFNEEGVPYVLNSSVNSISNYTFTKLTKTCTLKFHAGSDTKCIDIYPETGYVKVRECS